MKPRQVRERLGFTQRQLGAVVGAHWTTVARWEAGALAPSAWQAGLLEAFARVPRDVAERAAGELRGGGAVVGVLYVLLRASYGGV